MADEPEQVEADSKRLAEVHKRAMARFDSVALPQAEMRANALQNRRFPNIPGAMWEGAWGEEYENAPRPEMSLINPMREKIDTDFRENRLIVDFIPTGADADEDTAAMLDGVYRADNHHFKSQQARDNAFQEARDGGFGAYRLVTVKADEEDPDSEEQRVNPGLTIVDADQSVYFDGGSKVYDKSDAEWAFVITADPRAEAERKWPGDVEDWPLQNWAWGYDWYQPDVVRTAEYYEVEHSADRLITFTNDLTGETQRFWDSEIEASESADLTATGWTRKSKEAKRRRVHMYVMNGSKVLKDCGFIAGPNIPIVPMYGKRFFIDNMERFSGLVEAYKDFQRAFNSGMSKVIETSSTSPRSVPIFFTEEMSPLTADEWARGNIDRLAFQRRLPMRGENGELLNAGAPPMVQPPQIDQSTATILQIVSAQFTQEGQNAEQVKANTSAEAMDIAAARVDAKSFPYLDNARQSVQREGEIYKGMARDVYYEPGRKVDTLTDDDQDGQATLVEPHIDANGVFRMRNDLSRGRYKVVADVQESTATKRQKTARQAMEVATVAIQGQSMNLANVMLLTSASNMDGLPPDVQKYIRQQLLSLGAVEPTKEEQQQIQQAQEQQQNGTPDPQSQALLAAASNQASQAKLNEAKAVQTLADAHLKQAQADAVGGPESAPEVPSGLQAANDDAQAQDKLASARLKEAQAAKIHDDIGHQRIRTGHEIEMERREADRADRVADRPAA